MVPRLLSVVSSMTQPVALVLDHLPEVAIDHAQAAGDTDRVARLVASLVQLTYAAGRVDTVSRWLAWFEERDLIGRYPAVAALGAWLQALVGSRQLPSAGRLRPNAARLRGTLSDGSTMESYLALIHAGLCRDGVERMRADAGVARDGLAPESPLLGPALLFEGIAQLLAGEENRADAILDQAVEMAIHDRALPAAATALAERALLAIRRQDWSQAETLAG